MLIACFYLPEIGIAVETARVPYHKGEPMALASAAASVLAVSKEAKRVGISVGMTVAGARALCRSLVVLPYNRPVYEEASEAIWDTLATESSRVEPVSPEMVFIELAENYAMEQAERLAVLLSKHVGITVEVGIGSSKLVAEQAAKKDDKNYLLRVQVGMEAAFLAAVPIAALRSIPPAVQQRLQKLGVNTLGDILRLPESALSRQFKDIARKLQRLAVGEDGESVQTLWPPPSVEHDVQFEDNTGRSDDLITGIRQCAEQIAVELIRQRNYCRKVILRVVLADSSELRLAEPLRLATNSAADIALAGQRLLRRMAIDQPINSLQLNAAGLGTGSAVQLSLLAATDQTRDEFLQRERKLEETMVYVRKRFGVRAVVPASLFKTMHQAQLLIYPLGQRKRESVMVATDKAGEPLRFYRSRNCVRTKHIVESIQDQWNQATWSWEKILETHCYRVITDPWGLHQLEKLGVEWTLTGTAD